MAVITLISDLGKKDHYLASVKGSILKSVPNTEIIDISHEVRPFDIYEAAFILKHSYSYFPKGSVHVVSINDVITESNDHIVMEYDGHYFVGSDNGIFSIILEKEDANVYSLNIPMTANSLTFPMRDRFVTAACHLIRGGTAEVIGKRKSDWLRAEQFKPLLEPNVIRGQVIYVDGYENAITNISRQIFKDIGKGREFSINLVKSQETIRKITSSYSEVAPGRALAIFGGSGLLEIAISKGAPNMGGGAKSLLGLKINSTVRIEFS